MDECAACGRPVDDATYCETCTEDRATFVSSRSPQPTDDGVASPRARLVGAFLALAAVVGGVAAARSLVYLPDVLTYFDPLDSVGFLLTQAVNVALVVAFAVMAKRLFDDTADAPRYGRILQTLAIASVAFGVLVTILPDAVARWLPAVFDPGYVTLSVAARYLAPIVFSGPLTTLGVGVVGASVTFAAGTALATDNQR
jgi:hypothetical protein